MSQDLHLKNAKKNRSVKIIEVSLVRLTSQKLSLLGLRIQELEYFPALVNLTQQNRQHRYGDNFFAVPVFA